MKKQKKILINFVVFIIIVLLAGKVYAADVLNYLGEMELSKSFEEYTRLSDEEKEKVMLPRMYDIPKNKTSVTNPLKLAKMLGSSISAKYSLKDIIPENMVIKDQQKTNSCWTFASIAALESNLALKDYKSGRNVIAYDFSERHMEYATSKTFLNNIINDIGFNREVGSGGNYYLYIPYLTNGTGAIAESEMPFENNENKIDITKIQNKNVIAQVNNIVNFPSYEGTQDTTQIKQQMKNHIMNYGGIEAGIHGAKIFNVNGKCYNKETGAIYCNNKYTYPIDHAVTIVGWDDNYSVEKFTESNRPQNNGAWIIKNSWGGDKRYTLAQMKEYIFENYPNECATNKWTTADAIPDSVTITNFTNWGYTIDENNVATLKMGDNGFMYVSYEDVNIYRQLSGIIDAQNEITYENIYQYDQYGGYLPITFTTTKIYYATVFDKKTTKSEYLTQISINAPETYNCKVYVNPNGSSKATNDLQQVQLKTGESETFDAGYHTIEFLEPIKINSDSFVVVVEAQGMQTNKISAMMEFNFGEYFTDSSYANHGLHIFDNVTVETGKCFLGTEVDFNNDNMIDTSQMAIITSGSWPNFDTTIKAFTKTINVLEDIQITTPPTKTSYIVGQNFDKTGMVVKANYGNGKLDEITDYTITNGTNLALGQTSVTISYQGKTTTQPIEVVENIVENITIQTPPTKTEYWAGEDFDATGMVIQATYKDGTTEQITDYSIQDGASLKNGQTKVTIEYEGKTVTQAITVKANSVEKIEIKKAPDKVKYVVGQNFDKTGMIVEATYANGLVKQVENYTIQGGTNLQANQTTVTIEYEGKTVTQAITVEVKSVTSISVKNMPAKTEYIQNKEELDLTGGIIEIVYNDGTKEEMSMTSDEITVSGFNNEQLGTQTITLTYQGKTTQITVIIKELAKPVNSNLNNAKGNVKRIRAYHFSDANKKEYTVINVELSNILKAEENDKMEYYYYLSSNQKETDIVNWVKVNELKEVNNQLAFEINTFDISNYEDVANSEVLYLYVKEVAIKNNMKSEAITSSLLLEVDNINIEEYIDGKKKADVNSNEITDPTPGEKTDATVAQEKIPHAGRSLLIIFVIFAILVIGRVAYLKYKDIELK